MTLYKYLIISITTLALTTGCGYYKKTSATKETVSLEETAPIEKISSLDSIDGNIQDQGCNFTRLKEATPCK